MKKGVIALVVILIVLAVVAGVVIYSAFGGAKNAIDNPSQAFVSSGEDDDPVSTNDVNYDANENMGAVTLNGITYEPKADGDVVNVLLMGIDQDSTRDSARSDMLMLCSVDMKTNDISFTSVPRDTRTKVYKLDGEGKVKEELISKINAAYSWGGGPTKFSAENAMRCTLEFLECDGLINVPIDYYMSVDLDGLPKLASALDGVEVTLDQNMPEIGKKGETVNLKGNDVRLFLQNRHDMSDGETTRQLHEQMFIKSMASEIKEMGAVSAAPELYDTFTKFMRTNLTLDQILSFAATLDKTSIDNMQFNLIEGAAEVIDGVWYFRASQDDVIHKMLDVLYTQA